MKRSTRWIRFLVLLSMLLTLLGASLTVHAAAPTQGDATAAAIANAMSAAPLAVSAEATVIGWDTDGATPITLREGANGWTCFQDWPASPGNDPACYDSVFMAWNEAMVTGKEPANDETGIAYMLAGGSDPSNTDPTATEPADGEEWISTPPHIMIITPAGFDAAFISTEPKQDEPYIMWDGTPFEHLMVPVVQTSDEAMGFVDAEMANTLRAAPAGVALNATIMGYPDKVGDPMVVVKQGTNDWRCYPDGSSPGNDPGCNDSMMEAFWSIGDTQNVARVGLSYMLQGGSDPSNDDPSLSSPREGEEWVATARHVMLVIPGGFDEGHFTTDPLTGLPYIMYSDSGYEHLMIPVVDLPSTDEIAMQSVESTVTFHEFATANHMMGHDLAASTAETAADMILINKDGERQGAEAYLAGVSDELLTFDPPVRRNVQVHVISPDAGLIVYDADASGSYDGERFYTLENVSSLWERKDGVWQNTFVQSSPRTAAMAAVDAQIANTESSAPADVVENATIMGTLSDDGPMVMLRQGDNGWMCFPDWLGSPGNDPSCNDEVWMDMYAAFDAHAPYTVTKVGIAYMLAGGSDTSNTDPYGPIPTDPKDWVNTPGHVMILTPGGFDAADFPAEPKQDEPYIMWDGTPYEHLMQPVLPMTESVQIAVLDDPAAQEVLLAEQMLNYASDFLHDVDTANLMLADEYQEAGTGSKPVKTEKLAWIKSGVYIGQKAVFTDVTVEFDGDTATIHFTATFTGIYDGSPYNGEPSNVTNVWIRRDGRWQMLTGG